MEIPLSSVSMWCWISGFILIGQLDMEGTEPLAAAAPDRSTTALHAGRAVFALFMEGRGPAEFWYALHRSSLGLEFGFRVVAEVSLESVDVAEV